MAPEQDPEGLLDPASWLDPFQKHGIDPSWRTNRAALLDLIYGRSGGRLELDIHFGVRIPLDLWDLTPLTELSVTIFPLPLDDPRRLEDDFYYEDEPDLAVNDITYGISKSKRITHFEVHGVRTVDNETVADLGISLGENTTITSLTLSGADVKGRDPGDDIAEIVIRGLTRRSDGSASSIRKLDVRGLDMSVRKMGGDNSKSRTLVKLIRDGGTGVTDLALTIVNEDGTGLSILYDLIANNTSLESLDLSNSPLFDPGIREVFQGIAVNKTLKSLNVSSTNGANIDPVDAAGDAIMMALQRNDTLTRLTAEFVALSVPAFAKMMDGMQSNVSVIVLWIRGSIPRSGGAGQQISEMLSRNNTLYSFDISTTAFTRDEAAAITTGIRENHDRNPHAHTGLSVVFVGPKYDDVPWVDILYPPGYRPRTPEVYMRNDDGTMTLVTTRRK